MARRPERRKGAAAAIAGRPELAGDGRKGATELGFPNRKFPEREESEGNTPRTRTRPENRPSDCATADGGGLLRRAWPGCLEAPFCSGTRPEESGKGEEAHHGANSERKWLGMAASRGGGKLRRRFSARSRLGAEPRGERGKMGREVRTRRGGVSSSDRSAGEGGDRGRGGFGLGGGCRERREGGGSLEGKELTSGPHLPAHEREREGKGGNWPAGPGPRREERGGGVGPKGREGKRGKGKFHFLFFF